MSRKEAGFHRYQHVEHFGSPAVEGIDIGECYVFPKLDGINASVWSTKEHAISSVALNAGSRNRILTRENDNAGFYQDFLLKNVDMLWDLFDEHSNWIIYGEWLVPHTLKTYRESAWRKFYVFDVYDVRGGYIHYKYYAEVLKPLGFDVIEPLTSITNPTEEQLQKMVATNTYLIEDGQGAGEGIVIKNYGFLNAFGSENHAKIVRNESKEDARREFGYSERDGTATPEAKIIEHAITPDLVRKERTKIEVDIDPEDYRRALIPRLLDTMFHVLITEELYNTMHKLKLFGATVDFRKLRGHCVAATKKYADDLF